MPDRDELEQAIAHLGLPVGATIADLADLYRALARPSRLDAALRHLELEWIGAFDAPRPRASFLSRAELMHVLARSVGIDAIEAFSLQDLEDGMAYTESDIQGIFSNGHLWAYGHPDLRFPRWQFTHGRDGLPSGFICDRLQVVVAAIPLNANPGLVRSLMSLSSPTLPTVQGREISPREYLLAGGAPGTVAAFLMRYLDADADRVQDVASRMSAWS